MHYTVSRRRALAALGGTSAALAGCLGMLEDGPDDEADGDGGEGNGSGGAGGDGAGPAWPAIDEGEVVDDFEDLDRWYPLTGTIEPAPDEARTGTQAAVLESEEETAGMSLSFPDGLDLEGWDTSIAVKPESAVRIVVEFVAPTREERLNTVRQIPAEYDGWFRLDCGYEHKPEGEPDLSNVTRLNVVAVGPEGEPTRLLVDDLRRTEAVDNGKAILAFYGGRESHYEIAAEMMADRGWAGAVPVDPQRIGGSGRMTIDQLHDLRDRGWDVCSYPRSESDLTDRPEERQRTVVQSAREALRDRGFPDGARHFFAPEWRRLTPTTTSIVRDLHESGFLFGSCPTGAPPTGIHTTPVIWGPALHNGVRRHINLCDQYRQLTVIRVPRIVEGEADGNSMSLDDFEHLLDHIEHRGLDVVTPSDVVDGTMDTDGGASREEATKPQGTIVEPGESHSFDGSGTTVTGSFDLDGGVATVQFEHDGDSTFSIELSPRDADRATDVLEATASSDGEAIVPVDEGSYRLNVEADGEWTIDLDQPAVHADALAEPPIVASGEGTAFVGPVWAGADLDLTITHDGDDAFVVDGHGLDGGREQLVNRRGAFDASRSYAAGGVCWIAVDADGEWTIEVRDA